MHLGTERGSKAYRLFDPTRQRIVVSRDVVFNENKSWEWNKTDRVVIEKPGEFKISLGNHVNQQEEKDNESTIDNQADITHEEDDTVEDDDSNHDDEEQTEQFLPRRSNRISKKPGYLDDYIYIAEVEGERLLLLLDEEPWNFRDAMEEKVWREACEE